MKVLVLDHNSSDLEYISSLLKKMDADVLSSSDSCDAVNLYDSYAPDIIVMDPVFPDLHGYEIVKTIAEKNNTIISVLFVSHNMTSSDIISGISLGGECISKPVNPALFKAKIRVMQRAIVMRQRFAQMSEQLKLASQELKQFTHIDNLTGLINRTYLDESIQIELARGIRYQQPVAVLYVEIDYFTQYREFYGLQQSDSCLKQIAEILSGHCRRSMDIASHCGGELFTLVLPDTSADNAIQLAKRICDSIEAAQIPHKSSSVSNVCTVSIGVTSSIPHQGEKKENILRLADLALKQARSKGYNRVELVNFYTVKSESLSKKPA